jgi:hypothetical protein
VRDRLGEIAEARLIRTDDALEQRDALLARRAATALSTSAALPRLMRPIGSSVDGSRTSSVFGVTGGTHFPSM